jgi:hypothetical protein
MLAYLAWLVIAATPLVLGLVALIRADQRDIPKVTRALAQWGRKSLSPDESPPVPSADTPDTRTTRLPKQFQQHPQYGLRPLVTRRTSHVSRRGFSCPAGVGARFPAIAEPHRVITLEVDGQLVRITVERERSEDLAAYGFPADDREVYVTTWNDCHVDDTPTGPTAAARPARWPSGW